MVLSVKPSRTFPGSIPTKVRALVRPVKRATPKNAFGLAPLGIETANPEKVYGPLRGMVDVDCSSKLMAISEAHSDVLYGRCSTL